MTNKTDIFNVAVSNASVAGVVNEIIDNIMSLVKGTDSFVSCDGLVLMNRGLMVKLSEAMDHCLTPKDNMQQILDEMERRGMLKRASVNSLPQNPVYLIGRNGWDTIHFNDPVKADVKAPTKPTGSIDPKDFQQALEYIALDFLDKGVLKCRINGNEDNYRMERIQSVKGMIRDHGLTFRLTKPATGCFDVPANVCRVQLVATSYPMEAELLSIIMEFFSNPNH